jgi:hypothetical protein
LAVGFGFGLQTKNGLLKFALTNGKPTNRNFITQLHLLSYNVRILILTVIINFNIRIVNKLLRSLQRLIQNVKNETKFNGFLVLFLLMLVANYFRARRAVSGVVSDNAGLPLPGDVLVKGTKSGTQTDFDGKFSIKATPSQVFGI